MKTKHRVLEDDEQVWMGDAASVDQALEIAYDDETPGSLVTVTVQIWERPPGKVGAFRKMPQWVTLYKGKL